MSKPNNELREQIDQVFNKYLGDYKAVDDDDESGEVDYRYFKEHLSFWDAKEDEIIRLKRDLEALIHQSNLKAFRDGQKDAMEHGNPRMMAHWAEAVRQVITDYKAIPLKDLEE